MTNQMVGPVAILDRAQRAIIAEILVVSPNRGIELAAALTTLYHAEDYIMRGTQPRGKCVYSDLVTPNDTPDHYTDYDGITHTIPK